MNIKINDFYQDERNWEMDVRIYWGKSENEILQKAIEEFPNAYHKMSDKWFNNYNNEECVIINNFNPSNRFGSKRNSSILDLYSKLIDRYPMYVEYRGGSRIFNSKVIIFISNINPNEWFINNLRRESFFRKVKTIINI